MNYDFPAMTRAAIEDRMGRWPFGIVGQLQSEDANKREEALDFLRKYLPASVRKLIIPELLLAC